MKSLVCAVIGNGRFFTTRIESFLKVGDLVNMLKSEHPSVITCETQDVTLYLAKKTDNSWLKTSDPDAKKMAQGEFLRGSSTS